MQYILMKVLLLLYYTLHCIKFTLGPPKYQGRPRSARTVFILLPVFYSSYELALLKISYHSFHVKLNAEAGTSAYRPKTFRRRRQESIEEERDKEKMTGSFLKNGSLCFMAYCNIFPIWAFWRVSQISTLLCPNWYLVV